MLVEPLEGFTLRLTFDDGFVRTVDLESWLEGPVFEPLRSSQAYFRTVHLDSGRISWANGANIDSDVLRYDFLKPAGMKMGVGAITRAIFPEQKTSSRTNRSKKKQPSPTRSVTKLPRQTTLAKKSSPRA